MALPREQEESDPEFIHHAETDLPTVSTEGIDARIIAGSVLGETSPLQTTSATLYADVQLRQEADFPLDATYDERAVYVLSGAVCIGQDTFESGQLVMLKRGVPVTVKAKQTARFMVFGGEPMEGPRYIWWNFVSSRLERIEQAKKEWSKGRFDSVPGDEEEFIPLPEHGGKPKLATGASHNGT